MSGDGRDVDRLLADAGVPDDVTRAPGDEKLEAALAAELEAIARELPEQEAGGTRVVVAGRHVSIGKAAWKLITSVAALAISSLDPTGITKAVALKEALDLLKELRPLLRKLDPAKLLVCEAIAAVTAEHRRQASDRGATPQEIERHFTRHGEMAPVRLAELLASLESDGVIAATNYPQSGPHYKIVF